MRSCVRVCSCVVVYLTCAFIHVFITLALVRKLGNMIIYAGWGMLILPKFVLI